jgi:hypothetical protein
MIILTINELSRPRCHAEIDCAEDGRVLRISEPTRTLEQNALLWPLLHDVSKQVIWYGRKLDAEDWKHIFTASLTRMDVVPNIENTGFVAMGQSTSKMTKAQFSDLIQLIYAFGAEHDVKWSGNDHQDN